MQKRWGLWLLLWSMLFLGYSIPAQAKTAPLVRREAAVDGTVRVRLDSITSITYTLTIQGNYSINGDVSRMLKYGSRATVESSGGVFYLTAGGERMNMGAKFKLVRHERKGDNGLRIAEATKASNLYPGDLEFRMESGTPRTICHLFLEDYMYGVLPYEMDASFPLEALKAQAITARTFAIKRMMGNNGYYHVVDTTNDQVYRGTPSGQALCKRAVDETAGVVLMIGDAYCASYYTASNGGQTESAKNAWGGNQYRYLAVKDDPYDLANPSASVRSHLIYTKKSRNEAGLISLLQQKLLQKYNVADFSQILEVTPHTPEYPEPSRVYTQMRFKLAVDGKSDTYTVDIGIFTELEPLLDLGLTNGEKELYTVETEDRGFRIMVRRLGHGVGLSQRGAEQMARKGMGHEEILAFYFDSASRVGYTFVRADGTASPSAPITPSTSEGTYTVSLSNPSDKLNLRVSANTNAKVIARIPHGSQVVELEQQGVWAKVRFGGLSGYVMRSFLIKSSASRPENPAPTQGKLAWVWLSDPTEHLNVRLQPNTTSTILVRLEHGAQVEILDQHATWSFISWGDTRGYVMTSYLGNSKPANFGSTPAQTPNDTQEPVLATAVVQLRDANGTLNLRNEPRASSSVLIQLPNGTPVSVLSKGEVWCKVRSLGVSGYVMQSFLRFDSQNTSTSSPTNTITAAPSGKSAWVNLQSQRGSVNLRKGAYASATVLYRIPHATEVQVLEEGKTWCRVFYQTRTGYIATEFLSFHGKPGTTDASNMPDLVGAYAWISAESGTVNLRKEAASDSVILKKIPHGAKVEILSVYRGWCQIRDENTVGYVAEKSIAYTDPMATRQDTVTKSTTKLSGAVINTGVTALESAGSSLNIRATAREDAKVLDSVDHGAPVNVLSYEGDHAQWACIRTDKATGYVARSYLKLVYDIGVVTLGETDSTLAMRSAPSASATLMEAIPHGTGVTIIEKGSQWSRVRAPGGEEGYVATGYLKIN